MPTSWRIAVLCVVPKVARTYGPLLRELDTSLVEVDGAERLECADGALWILETEPG